MPVHTDTLSEFISQFLSNNLKDLIAHFFKGRLILSKGIIKGQFIKIQTQLFTVLALTEPGTSADVSWARGREPMSGKASF